MRVTLPIANGFYVSDSLPISAQRCVNWRPNIPQASSITDANLFPTDGIVEVVSGSLNEECRGAHVMNGIPYFVIGTTLYKLNQVITEETTYNLESLGNIAGVSRVYMADNGSQLCIVAPPDTITAGVSYIYDGTLQTITDPNFDGPAASVVYANGYFVFHRSTGKKFFHSNLLDGLTYDAADFNTAEADPDQIRGLGVIKNQLYVFGSETIQIFRDIGRTPSTFAPISGAVLDVGVTDGQSIINFNGNLAFIGSGVNQSPAAWLLAGSQLQKISTTAIENELRGVSDVYCWTYADSGAYYLGVAISDTCFVYDLNNSRWHERQSINRESLSAYRVTHVVSAYDGLFVGDTQTGGVGKIEKDIYLEYGVLVPRFVTSQPFENQGSPIFVSSIEAVIDAGNALANDVNIVAGKTPALVDIVGTGGSDPMMALSWSDDGGKKYSDPISRSIGKVGETEKRPTWSRVGRIGRQRVLKVECSSPTKAVLIKMEADFG